MAGGFAMIAGIGTHRWVTKQQEEHAIEVGTGRVEGMTARRHTSAEFVRFLHQLVATQPVRREIQQNSTGTRQLGRLTVTGSLRSCQGRCATRRRSS